MKVKITQIESTSNGLYGVGADGAIYVYCGHKYGWTQLNMALMTSAALKKKREEFLNKDEEPF